MTNIAQMVNVLQAMILTDRERMVLTPTYHVFEMYKVHQGATCLPVETVTPEYTRDGKTLPMVHASASRDRGGSIHLSMANLHPHEAVRVLVNIAGTGVTNLSGQLLTAGAMDAHNTFEMPDAVKPQTFHDIERTGDQFSITLPAKSVLTIAMR